MHNLATSCTTVCVVHAYHIILRRTLLVVASVDNICVYIMHIMCILARVVLVHMHTDTASPEDFDRGGVHAACVRCCIHTS